jgi:hypothetical protein
MAKKKIEDIIKKASEEGKMIPKVILFNPNSKRHVEILKWLEEEQDNFSSYGREILAIQYENSKKQGPSFDDGFDITKMI